MSRLTTTVSTTNIDEISEAEKRLIFAYRAADETAQKYALEILMAHPRATTEENLA